MTRTGQRSVTIRTTGHDKGRFTVVLAAMADGKKLKPFVVFKGVRPVAELHKVSGVIVAYSRNGWMNEGLTIDWVKRGLRNIQFCTSSFGLGCLQMLSHAECQNCSRQAYKH